MSWGKFRDRVVGTVKNTGQSLIDAGRGQADSDDWKNIARVGTMGGSALYDDYLFPKDEQTMVQGEDPRVTAIRNRAAGEARDFRTNLPNYIRDQMAPEQMQANVSEREGRQNVNRASSRRGLLDSGITQRGQADIGAQKASTLAEARFNINRQANELADLKSDIAAGIGISDMGSMLEQQARLQDQAREAAAQRREAYNQIGQGLGYGAGTYAGIKSKQAGGGGGTGLLTMNYDPSTYGGMA